MVQIEQVMSSVRPHYFYAQLCNDTMVDSFQRDHRANVLYLFNSKAIKECQRRPQTIKKIKEMVRNQLISTSVHPHDYATPL